MLWEKLSICSFSYCFYASQQSCIYELLRDLNVAQLFSLLRCLQHLSELVYQGLSHNRIVTTLCGIYERTPSRCEFAKDSAASSTLMKLLHTIFQSMSYTIQDTRSLFTNPMTCILLCINVCTEYYYDYNGTWEEHHNLHRLSSWCPLEK